METKTFDILWRENKQTENYTLDLGQFGIISLQSVPFYFHATFVPTLIV